MPIGGQLTAERKGSKGSITNTDEIVADTQAASAATIVAPSPKVATMHEENEKTGETIDVSDKSK